MCMVWMMRERKYRTHPKVMPRLKAKIYHEQGNFIFSIFPDSGGSLTIISADIVNKEKIPVDHGCRTPKLIAVNGKKIKVDGVAAIGIKNLHNGMMVRVLAIVSPDVKNDIIVGYLYK